MQHLHEFAVLLDLRRNLKVFSAMNQDQFLLFLSAEGLAKALTLMKRIPEALSVTCQVLFFLRLLIEQLSGRGNGMHNINKLE